MFTASISRFLSRRLILIETYPGLNGHAQKRFQILLEFSWELLISETNPLPLFPTESLNSVYCSILRIAELHIVYSGELVNKLRAENFTSSLLAES